MLIISVYSCLFKSTWHCVFLTLLNSTQFFSHHLEECPQLGIMDGLQLLNLQHNLITTIQHLSQLQQLVFLNLYDNQISEMTGIEALCSLRILMLGKNRLVFTDGLTDLQAQEYVTLVCISPITQIVLGDLQLW